MKKSAYALMTVDLILWGYLAWSGVDGIRAIRAQHVSGYPNHQQIEFYLAFPLLMIAAVLAAPILLRRTRWSGAGTAFLIVAFLLSIPFGCFYTGGV